jgi:hypothetical protein
MAYEFSIIAGSVVSVLGRSPDGAAARESAKPPPMDRLAIAQILNNGCGSSSTYRLSLAFYRKRTDGMRLDRGNSLKGTTFRLSEIVVRSALLALKETYDWSC